MTYNKARMKATNKYMADKYKTLSTKVKNEDYEKYNQAAKNLGMSFRSFMLQAMDEKIARDGIKTIDTEMRFTEWLSKIRVISQDDYDEMSKEERNYLFAEYEAWKGQ